MNIHKKANGILTESLLSKRSLLENLDSIDFYGKYIKLLPLDIARDSKELYEISNGSSIQRPNKSIDEYDSNELIWKYLSMGPFDSLADFTSYLQHIMTYSNTRIYCMYDIIHNYHIGMIANQRNSPENLRTEIGSVWLSPIAQGSKAATEACYLLLNNAFELGYRRVNWITLKENIRSHNFATKIGFSTELPQKNFCIVKNRTWDVLFHRILDYEWPEIKLRLQERLYQ